MTLETIATLSDDATVMTVAGQAAQRSARLGHNQGVQITWYLGPAILNPVFEQILRVLFGRSERLWRDVFPVQGGRILASAIERSKCPQSSNTTYVVMVRRCSKNR
jgi:hypothetical protein